MSVRLAARARVRSPRPGIVVGGSVVVAGLMVWRADWSALSAVSGSDNWMLLAAAAGLILLAVPAKLVVWWAVLSCAPAGRGRVRIRDLTGGVLIGAFLNAIAPARLGELARIALTFRRLERRGARVDVATLSASIVGESLISGLGWTLFVAIAATVTAVPTAAKVAAASLITIVVLVFAVAVRGGSLGVSRPLRPGRLRLFVRQLWQATATTLQALLRRPRLLAVVVLISLCAWLVQALAVQLTLVVFDVANVGPEGVVLVVVAVSTAQLIPVMPGNAGLVAPAVALALAPFDVAVGPALAVGLMVSLLQLAGLVCGGLLGAVWEGTELTRAFRRPSSGPWWAPPGGPLDTDV